MASRIYIQTHNVNGISARFKDILDEFHAVTVREPIIRGAISAKAIACNEE